MSYLENFLRKERGVAIGKRPMHENMLQGEKFAALRTQTINGQPVCLKSLIFFKEFKD